MNKRRIVELLIERLQAELDGVTRAAQAAHEAATHESAKPENQYDTRGLEASYLAGAQAQRVTEISALISAYRLMPLPEPGPRDPIEPGMLVELELELGNARPSSSSKGRRSYYLLMPRGGGISIQIDGCSVLALAPGAPMGEALMGRRVDDVIEVETKDQVREYRVVSVL